MYGQGINVVIQAADDMYWACRNTQETETYRESEILMEILLACYEMLVILPGHPVLSWDNRDISVD